VNVLLLVLSAMAASVDGGAVDGGTATDAGAAGERPSIPDAAAFLPTPAAVPVRLHGRVLAKGSRGFLAGASVAINHDGTGPMTETDAQGKFDLLVDCGPQAIVARATGYESLSLTYDACANPEPLLLRLTPRRNLPVYETVVVASTDEPALDLRGPELTTTPGALGDPFRTIESLPGVATVAWPAPIYAIRGSNPGNTGYFLDDLPVPLLFHLALGPSVIHPDFFDSMAFYPGGYPARYGRYVGGVVAAETRAPPEDRLHAEADVRLYDAGGLLSVPFPDGNGGVTVGFRYSYTGALLSHLQNDLTLSYWDYQVRADRRVRGWRLSLLTFGSGDNLAYRYDPSSPKQDYVLRFHRVSLRATRSFAGGELSLRLAFGADSSTAPIVEYFPIHADAYSILPRARFARVGKLADVEAGIDGELQWLRPSLSRDEAGASDLARDRAAVLAAAYVATTVRATNRLSLTPALRLDSYVISGATRADLGPRLAARFRLSDKDWLSGSAGRFSQPPSLSVQIPAAENFGLALYGLQTAWQAALGFGSSRLPGIETEVTGYVQRYVLTDLRDPTLLHPDPLASDFLVRRDARSYGLEVMLRRPSTERLHGWISYTLSKSERVLGGVVGPSDWDQRHILNLVLGYRIGRYELGARGHFNSGRPVLVSGAQAEAFVRLPAFYQLDLRAERAILFDAFTLTVYAEVVNTTLSREVYGLDRKDDGTLTERSLRIVLPSVGIRGEL
jgi:hypothetical protein